MSNKEIPEWIKQHQAKNEEEDESEFFKFPEGETEIEVDISKPPKQVEKFEGKTRYQYQIRVDDEQKTLEVGKQLDRHIIMALMRGLNPMVVIRIGDDIHTKYSVKGLKD